MTDRPVGTPVNARHPVREALSEAQQPDCVPLSVFRQGKRETRGRLFQIAAEAHAGVQNIMTMKPRVKGAAQRRKEFPMLSLQLNSGEYLTIGEDIVVQVFGGSAARVMVQAPRELTILRGEVWERNGKKRPGCLLPVK